MNTFRGLDEERTEVYADLIIASLSEGARAVLERLMATGNYVFHPDLVPRFREMLSNALRPHLEKEAREKAEKEVRANLRADVEKEVRESARAEAEAEAVVTFLEARGLPIDPDARTRILGCTDSKILDRWVRQAATVSAVDELFRADESND